MEMERINANTIRVMLGNDDLAQRGITVLDLLGNHKQIESFFYSILDEVDKDHTFATNEAVTFQVMPSQSGLELLISKSGQKTMIAQPIRLMTKVRIPRCLIIFVSNCKDLMPVINKIIRQLMKAAILMPTKHHRLSLF